MRVEDMKPIRQASGASLYQRRLVDEAQCPAEGPESDQRRLYMLRTFATQPDLWRLPQAAGYFSKMRMQWLAGRWTIELERLGPRPGAQTSKV